MNRQSIIHNLTDISALPWETLYYCLEHPGETEQIFLMRLERAMRMPETLEEVERNALFYGIHLLGALEVMPARAPLLALLRGDQKIAADLIGDAIGTTIPRVLMTFADDDVSDYWEAICTPSIDWLVRDAFLKAWTFHMLEDRSNLKDAETSLRSLPDILKLSPDDMFWLSWMTAIAHLGLSELAAEVPERIAGNQIDASLQTVSAADLADFEAILQDALERNQSEDWRAQNGYIPFGPSFADFELASRTFLSRAGTADTPRLVAADNERPFGAPQD